MGTFRALSKVEVRELNDLLCVADSILKTKTAVIKGNSKAATIVGAALGGAAGAAIATSAGTAGVAGVISGSALFVGGGSIALGAAAIGALPITIVVLLGSGIGLLIGRNKKKKKEQQKQANYVKQIVEKMQKILDKYEALKEEHERTSKEKDEIIKQQKEKLAEYEAIFEALKKKRKDLEENLSFS